MSLPVLPSIGGSVVEFLPATRYIRVRLPAGATYYLRSKNAQIIITE